MHKIFFWNYNKNKDNDFNGIAYFSFSSHQLLEEEATSMQIQSVVGGQHHPMLVVGESKLVVVGNGLVEVESKLVVVEYGLEEEVSELVVVGSGLEEEVGELEVMENVLGEVERDLVLVVEENGLVEVEN